VRSAILPGVVTAALLALGATQPTLTAPRPAPPFTLELFSGKSLALADLRGKGVVLLFWAPW